MKRIFSFFVAAVLCVGCLVAQQRERSLLSETTARSFIDRFPDPDVIRWGSDRNHFTWQSGYVLFAMERMWRLTNDSRYLNYVRRFVDQNVGADGSVPNFNPGALDNFLPGYACLLMYELTGEQRYARAAETIRHGFDDYPRTAEGMFTHNRGTAQVWVDGVFMGQMFLARYAKTMRHPEDFDEVARQIRGIFRLCSTDDGLLYHGWSPKGRAPWARDADSYSTDVWSEGLGWVAVLMADVFDYLPANHESRAELERLTTRLCEGLAKHQDKNTGLWCQVVQRENDEGNWNETSGSGMFTYLLQRSVDRGFVPAEKYMPIIRKAYEGLRTKAIRNADGNINLTDCSSIGIQNDYRAYITQTREISTFAALASFMLGTGIVEHHILHQLQTPFYVTDYTQGRVMRFENGLATWQHEAPLSNDLWQLPSGNLLFTTGQGVLELDGKGNKVFEYKTKAHVFACQRLANGNTFVGECETGRLLEISPKGRIVHQTCILPKGTRNADMAFMRNARRLEDGHYLVAHYGPERVTEYDHNGRVVWDVAVPGRPHSVIRMPNGNTLVAVADGDNNPRILEFSPTKEIVWQLTNDDLAGRPLRFLSGMQYIEGRGLFLTNWQGHLSRVEQPHMLWVTREKKIRAVLPPMAGLRTCSSVFIPQEKGSEQH